MANHNKVQSDKLRAQIAQIRDKIALTDSEEECQMYLDQIDELKEKIRKINRKEPVVVPVKNASTVGDKIERRLKQGKRRTASSYSRSRVRL